MEAEKCAKIAKEARTGTRHARMLKISMCSPGKDGFSCCFYLSCWALLFVAFLDRNLPEPFVFRGELPSFFMPAPGKCRDPSFDACATAFRSPFSRRIVRKIWLQPFPWSNRLRCACYFFWISLLPPLLMEKKSCTTWDGAKTLYIMGE